MLERKKQASEEKEYLLILYLRVLLILLAQISRVWSGWHSCWGNNVKHKVCKVWNFGQVTTKKKCFAGGRMFWFTNQGINLNPGDREIIVASGKPSSSSKLSSKFTNLKLCTLPEDVNCQCVTVPSRFCGLEIYGLGGGNDFGKGSIKSLPSEMYIE